MKRKRKSKQLLAEGILHSPTATIAFSLISIAVCINFIPSQNENTPLARPEAISYSVELDRYYNL